MSTKLAIARETLAVWVSTLVVQGAALGVGIYVRRALGPEAMGVWALLQVIAGYISYTNLGMAAAVSREIPVLRGSGAPAERLEAIRNAGWAYITAVSAATTAALLGAAVFLRGRLEPPVLWGLVTLAALTWLERTNNYRVQILYTEKAFVFASRFRVVSALANAAFVALFVPPAGLYGLYLAQIASFAFNAVYLGLRSGVSFRFARDPAEVLRLLRFGVPLFALTALTAFFNSLDKLAVTRFLGFRELGLYSVAIMASGFLFMLPNMFQVVILSRTLERFGDPADDRGREAYALLPGRLMSVYFSLVLAAFWLLAGPFTRSVLPEYVEGVPALKAALFGAAFTALAQQMSHILLGWKRHLRMLPVLAVFAAGLWASAGLAAARGGGLASIALAAAGFAGLAYAASFVLSFAGRWNARRILGELAWNAAPLGACALALAAHDAVWRGPLGWGASFLHLGLYAVLWLLLLGALEKRLGVLRLVRGTFREWRAAGRARAPEGALS